MKRFRTILALILTLSLAESIIDIKTEETVPEQQRQSAARCPWSRGRPTCGR